MSAYWERIPARPTTYRGVPMRSRLEASFAAGLDDIETPWTYEPRAFASQAGQYLPDFDVSANGVSAYIEVRPTLEAALSALERMQIIWESEPQALLLVVWPDDGEWRIIAADGETHHWQVFRRSS